MKDVGEPLAGEPHEWFDGRELETGTHGQGHRSGTAPRETAGIRRLRGLPPTPTTAPAPDPTILVGGKRTGNGPTVAAVLRNTAIGYHRSNGEPNIARATRRANRRSDQLVDAVTSSYPTTQ